MGGPSELGPAQLGATLIANQLQLKSVPEAAPRRVQITSETLFQAPPMDSPLPTDAGPSGFGAYEPMELKSALSSSRRPKGIKKISGLSWSFLSRSSSAEEQAWVSFGPESLASIRRSKRGRAEKVQGTEELLANLILRGKHAETKKITLNKILPRFLR